MTGLGKISHLVKELFVDLSLVILSPGILQKSCLIKMPGWRISCIISEIANIRLIAQHVKKLISW